MITFQTKGRLGNTLFQFAAAYSYCKKYSHELLLPADFQTNELSFLSQSFRCGNFGGNVEVHKEPIDQSYAEISYYNVEQRILLDGYFQSEKYFADNRNDILKMLRIGNDDSTHQAISIHVRRTDFISASDQFPVPSIEYYTKAIQYFIDKGYRLFIIYTDDRTWCLENFDIRFYLEKYNTLIVHHEAYGPWQDMQSAALCKHNIGSNSTYSWWIAYLNQHLDKECIFPTKWYGPALSYLSTKDLLLDNGWIRLLVQDGFIDQPTGIQNNRQENYETKHPPDAIGYLLPDGSLISDNNYQLLSYAEKMQCRIYNSDTDNNLKSEEQKEAEPFAWPRIRSKE